MARMRGAIWKPLPRGFSVPMARHDLVIIHTCVGSLAGTDGYFRSGKTSANSHFGTGGGGEIWQWGDTAKRSAANAAANPRSITIENADMGPGFGAWNTNDGNAVPPFTPQQLEANARICAWANMEHGIPLERVPDSKPGRRGIAFHRLGVPGYAVAGGELWSSARGKVCPGPKRIAQIDAVIARARQLVGGTPAPAPAPPVPVGAGPLRRGSVGADVRRLQDFMTKAFKSYNPYTPNGTFGPATEAGVREFQKRTGLSADGVVGPATLAKLRVFGFKG